MKQQQPLLSIIFKFLSTISFKIHLFMLIYLPTLFLSGYQIWGLIIAQESSIQPAFKWMFQINQLQNKLILLYMFAILQLIVFVYIIMTIIRLSFQNTYKTQQQNILIHKISQIIINFGFVVFHLFPLNLIGLCFNVIIKNQNSTELQISLAFISLILYLLVFFPLYNFIIFNDQPYNNGNMMCTIQYFNVLRLISILKLTLILTRYFIQNNSIKSTFFGVLSLFFLSSLIFIFLKSPLIHYYYDKSTRIIVYGTSFSFFVRFLEFITGQILPIGYIIIGTILGIITLLYLSDLRVNAILKREKVSIKQIKIVLFLINERKSYNLIYIFIATHQSKCLDLECPCKKIKQIQHLQAQIDILYELTVYLIKKNYEQPIYHQLHQGISLNRSQKKLSKLISLFSIYSGTLTLKLNQWNLTYNKFQTLQTFLKKINHVCYYFKAQIRNFRKQYELNLQIKYKKENAINEYAKKYSQYQIMIEQFYYLLKKIKKIQIQIWKQLQYEQPYQQKIIQLIKKAYQVHCVLQRKYEELINKNIQSQKIMYHFYYQYKIFVCNQYVQRKKMKFVQTQRPISIDLQKYSYKSKTALCKIYIDNDSNFGNILFSNYFFHQLIDDFNLSEKINVNISEFLPLQFVQIHKQKMLTFLCSSPIQLQKNNSILINRNKFLKQISILVQIIPSLQNGFTAFAFLTPQKQRNLIICNRYGAVKFYSEKFFTQIYKHYEQDQYILDDFDQLKMNDLIRKKKIDLLIHNDAWNISLVNQLGRMLEEKQNTLYICLLKRSDQIQDKLRNLMIFQFADLFNNSMDLNDAFNQVNVQTNIFGIFETLERQQNSDPIRSRKKQKNSSISNQFKLTGTQVGDEKMSIFLKQHHQKNKKIKVKVQNKMKSSSNKTRQSVSSLSAIKKRQSIKSKTKQKQQKKKNKLDQFFQAIKNLNKGKRFISWNMFNALGFVMLSFVPSFIIFISINKQSYIRQTFLKRQNVYKMSSNINEELYFLRKANIESYYNKNIEKFMYHKNQMSQLNLQSTQIFDKNQINGQFTYGYKISQGKIVTRFQQDYSQLLKMQIFVGITYLSSSKFQDFNFPLRIFQNKQPLNSIQLNFYQVIINSLISVINKNHEFINKVKSQSNCKLGGCFWQQKSLFLIIAGISLFFVTLSFMFYYNFRVLKIKNKAYGFMKILTKKTISERKSKLDMYSLKYLQFENQNFSDSQDQQGQSGKFILSYKQIQRIRKNPKNTDKSSGLSSINLHKHNRKKIKNYIPQRVTTQSLQAIMMSHLNYSNLKKPPAGFKVPQFSCSKLFLKYFLLISPLLILFLGFLIYQFLFNSFIINKIQGRDLLLQKILLTKQIKLFTLQLGLSSKINFLIDQSILYTDVSKSLQNLIENYYEVQRNISMTFDGNLFTKQTNQMINLINNIDVCQKIQSFLQNQRSLNISKLNSQFLFTQSQCEDIYGYDYLARGMKASVIAFLQRSRNILFRYGYCVQCDKKNFIQQFLKLIDHKIMAALQPYFQIILYYLVDRVQKEIDFFINIHFYVMLGVSILGFVSIIIITTYLGIFMKKKIFNELLQVQAIFYIISQKYMRENQQISKIIYENIQIQYLK